MADGREATTIGDRVAGLRMALSQQQARVMDFLRTWDADGSGEIEKKVRDAPLFLRAV